MSSDDNGKTTKQRYLYKFWFAYELRNTKTDVSERRNVTLHLSRKPKDENDIVAVEQMLLPQVYKLPNIKDMRLTLLAWPHYLEKRLEEEVIAESIQRAQSLQALKKSREDSAKKQRPTLRLLKGGKQEDEKKPQ